MYQIGNEILKKTKFRLLFYTFNHWNSWKDSEFITRQSQTGPAIRNDEKTIAAHQAFLTDENKHDLSNNNKINTK
jgi:hypothetical protein